MSKYRITATFDFECCEWENEAEILEGIRRDVCDVIECWETSNIKVVAEDEECIERNDRIKTN